MVDSQHFCLRWNNYQSSLTSAFENLRDDEDFVDVTLACEGRSLKAHRVVLSACSPYFRELLKSTPCKHPVIVLQDVSFSDLHALVEFIYHGEVNVHQRSLTSFLKTAEVLRVSGLTQQQDDKEELRPPTPRNHQGYADKVDDPVFLAPSPPPLTAANQLPGQISGRKIAGRRESEQSSDYEGAMPKRAKCDSNDVSEIPAVSIPKIKKDDGISADVNSHSENASSSLLDNLKSEPVDMGGAVDHNDSSSGQDKSDDAIIDDNDSLSGIVGPPYLPVSGETTLQPVPPLLPTFASALAEQAAAGSFGSFLGVARTSASSDSGGTSAVVSLGGTTGTNDNGAGTSSQGSRPMSKIPPPTSNLNEPQECPSCKRMFSCYYSLKRHYQDRHEHSDTLYQCEFCNRSYRTKNSLTTHKSLRHRETNIMLKKLFKDGVKSMEEIHQTFGKHF